jgi:ABC-type lipoprotein release transport system permease subunit
VKQPAPLTIAALFLIVLHHTPPGLMLLASLLPARRAARVDPAVVLRED